MKKLLIYACLIVLTTAGKSFAQGKQSFLQGLLGSYYDIKDALVHSDSHTAGLRSADFLKALEAVDMKTLPDSSMKAFMFLHDKLSFDAGHISKSKDLAHQREHFANFSSNFFKLAKVVTLTDREVYYDYCPMKKSYWLSAEASIKNPYYGSQMLGCGKVSETLNKK